MKSGRLKVMKDKSLSIFLIVLFGMSGIAILLLTWLRPMPESERILDTFIGSVGLCVALANTLLLKSPRVRRDDKQPVVEVEVRGKS